MNPSQIDAMIATLPSARAPYWAAIGPVRGWCGHKHRSEEAAQRCASSDHQGCRTQGGYSDRRAVEKPAR